MEPQPTDTTSDARQRQQQQLARQLRYRKAAANRSGFAGFMNFDAQLTPFIIRLTHIVWLVICGAAVVYLLVEGKGWWMIGVAVLYLLGRLVLEASMVLFRLGEDTRELREQGERRELEIRR